MNTELEAMKQFLKENHANAQLMAIFRDEKKGYKANVCGLDFELLGQLTHNDSWGYGYPDQEYIFSLAGTTYKVIHPFSSWGDTDEGDLLYRMELAGNE